MLLKTSQSSVKSAFSYLTKIPFTKKVLRRLGEAARGKSIGFFSLHRVFNDHASSETHPHFLNKTALKKCQTEQILRHIQRSLSFIHMSDALNLLRGNARIPRSSAVLLIECPYIETIDLLLPLLEELKIPVTFAINIDQIETGQMSWTDELVYRVLSSNNQDLSLNFIDRAFTFSSVADKIQAASHLIDNLSARAPDARKARLDQIIDALGDFATLPALEKICSPERIAELASHPLISFIATNEQGFFSESGQQIISAAQLSDDKLRLRKLVKAALCPVFFHGAKTELKFSSELLKLLIEAEFEAAIGKSTGLARPGDNMFNLARLPLAQGVKSFEQFELQGLSEAIDEFLLVTWAREKER